MVSLLMMKSNSRIASGYAMNSWPTMYRHIPMEERTKRLLEPKLNNAFDKLVRTEIYILTNPWPAFKVCIYSGVVFGLILTVMMGSLIGLSTSLTACILLAAIAACFVQAMITRVLTGRENFIYYHQLILVMITAAMAAKLFDQPILPYLDITMIGMAGVQVFGRTGCLLAGCCHGRPHRWGVCYRAEHARDGFTRYYVNVRLFPIQLVESLWVLGIASGGIMLVLNAHAPGTVVAWYIITYGAGRFCFEFMRGDPDRAYYWDFSEAQWISLLLMSVVVWAELSGLLALHAWHTAATAGVILTVIVVALTRHFRKTPTHRLLNPRHIKEVAEAVEAISSLLQESALLSRWNPIPPAVHIARTSLGVRISASKILRNTSYTYHYALSSENETMTEETAGILARLIVQLRHPAASGDLVRGSRDVFHVLIDPLQQNDAGQITGRVPTTNG
jgi:prolipoprotein diacylglyceryltransferase